MFQHPRNDYNKIINIINTTTLCKAYSYLLLPWGKVNFTSPQGQVGWVCLNNYFLEHIPGSD